MINEEIKVSKKEFYRLLGNCMVLENLIKNVKLNNYKLDVTDDSLKDHYENMLEEVTDTIRIATKKLDRLYKQELKEKEYKSKRANKKYKK